MTQRALRLTYWISLAITFATLGALAIIDQHLKTPASPLGIVSFELCAYGSSCDAIASSWGGEAKLQAAMSLGLDYLFMLAYPATICCGLLLLEKQVPASLKMPAMVLAWVVWGAGMSDAVENYHLYQMLLGKPVIAHQWPATIAASIKFAILVPPLLAWLLATIWFGLPFRARQAVKA